MSFSSSEWVQSAVCAGAGALAMYLLMKSDSEKDEVVAAPVKKQTDSISVVNAGEKVYLPFGTLAKITTECLVAAGVPLPQAATVADVLVTADARNVPSHGVNRLEMYLSEIAAGDIDVAAQPVIAAESASTAKVDGKNALGAVVSNFAIDLAITKAKATGVAVVTCGHSNHYGIAGYYALKAAEAGMIGFAMTNTSPFVVPTRALPGPGTAIGTNAMAVAANATAGDAFCMDMATSGVAVGKVEVCHRKGVEVPHGWGLDKNGESTTVPAKMLPTAGGALLPLGGVEETAGYKGYALGMMVEMLCGVLPNAATGPDVQPWKPGRPRAIDYGHCFLVIDPSRFEGEGESRTSVAGETAAFPARLSKYLAKMRSLPTAPGAPGPVLVPGDPEVAASVQSREGGVGLNTKVAASLKALAVSYGVALPPVLEELKVTAPKHYNHGK